MASDWYVHAADVSWHNLDEQIGPFPDDIRSRASVGLEVAGMLGRC
jgi:hypothetical protein